MKKISILAIAFFFCFAVAKNIKAESEAFEVKYFELGYEDISQAIQKGEKSFKRSILLPTKMPSVPFTNVLGRFSNAEGQENDDLEIKFINENSSQNHYIIRIKPIEYGLKIEDEQIDERLKLNDGSEAIYSTQISGFHVLIFEHEKLEYILSLDKVHSKEKTKRVLIDIANSMRDK